MARQFVYKLEIDPTACTQWGEDYELLFLQSDQNDYNKNRSSNQRIISIVNI